MQRNEWLCACYRCDLRGGCDGRRCVAFLFLGGRQNCPLDTCGKKRMPDGDGVKIKGCRAREQCRSTSAGPQWRFAGKGMMADAPQLGGRTHRHRRAVPPSSNLPAASHLSQVNTRVVWGVGCCSAARVRPTHLCIFVPRPSSRVGCATDERPPISNSSSRHQSGWELEGNQLVRPCVCVCVAAADNPNPTLHHTTISLW